MPMPTTPAAANGAPGAAPAIATNMGADAGRGRTRAFRFGDAERVLDRRDLISYAECALNGRWYEPPLPPKGLARAYRATAHHSSALQYKRDQLVRHFKPSRLLDRRNFADFALNFVTMGNAYLERRDSLGGRALTLRNAPAIHTRRGREDGQFFWVPGYKMETEFAQGSVFQLYETDLEQEIYGVPEYLAAMQSAFLNEQSTLFRRRYYENGSHAGFIFYLSEPTMSDEDADDLEEALAESKGVGNFKNLFIHAPSGKKDGVQIIPIGEAAAKDEFLGIKQATTEDILAAHRVPPILLGFVPRNAGGLGSIIDAANAFHWNVIEPIQTRMLEVNDWLGEEVIAFAPFQPMTKNPNASPREQAA